MKRVVLLVVLASCSKRDPAGPIAKAEPSTDFYAGSHGVVVTADDVRVDGKSLGILPSRLATDRDALTQAVLDSIGSNGKSALAFAYTDDAAGDAVLGALRGIEDRIARPRARAMAPDDDANGGAGTAMALDEGKTSRNSEAPHDPPLEIAVTAIVGGKPTEICRVLAPPLADPHDADDDHVELTLQISHAHVIRGVTRVREIATIGMPDLDHELHTQKASAFFSDRDDIELAAAPDAKGADVTPVLASSCKAGFREVQPLSLDELTKQLAQK